MATFISDVLRSVFVLLPLLTVATANANYSNFGECRVLLTVSPLTRLNQQGTQTLFRDLAVAWEFPASRCASLQADRIEIINDEPSKPHKTVWSISLSETGESSGHEVTNISISSYGENGNAAGGVFFPPKLPCGWDPPPELLSSVPYKPQSGPCCIANMWAVAYSAKGELLDKACVRIQPTWMQDNAKILADITLDQLLIPGTHNTGSYARYDYEESSLWRFILTQDTPIWHQLVFGVRHLDLRIGYYPEPIGEAADPGSPDAQYRFWVNHDMIRVQPLLPILRDIRAFLNAAPKEVIFLDLHRFPVGFGASNESDPRATAHEKLLDLLEKELGDLLAISPPSVEGPIPPFRQFQEGPGRILVFYGKKGFTEKYPFLWPPLNQAWADARRRPELMTFLQEAMNTLPYKRQMWAAMAELTPSAYDVFFNFAGSLRKLAEEVNYDISSKLFFDWQFDANIVAVDFVLGSSVVEAAIVSNYKRAKARGLIVDKIFLSEMQSGASPVAAARAHRPVETDHFYYDEVVGTSESANSTTAS